MNWKKAVSFLLLNTFIIQYFPTNTDAQGLPLASFVKQSSIQFSNALPPSVAQIEASVIHAQKPLVYLIQDAHTNPSSQANIAKTLELLLQQEPISHVFVEGGKGNQSLSFMREYGSRQAREKAAKPFLKSGELQGEEYFDLVSDKEFLLWGVESQALYDQARETYRQIVASRNKQLSYIRQISATFHDLREPYLNHGLAALMHQIEKHRAGEISFSDYLDALRNPQNASSDFFLVWNQIRSLEKSIDFAKAQTEEAEALKSLNTEEREKFQETVYQAKPFASRSAGEMAFFALLEERFKNDARFPELQKYLAYVRQVESIDWLRVSSQISDLEHQALKYAARSVDEKKWVESFEVLDALEKLTSLKATPGDSAVLDDLSVWDLTQLTGFINGKIAESHKHTERAIFLEKDFEEYLNLCRRFYKLTAERDQAFIQNIQAVAPNKSVLIVGGYHAEDLKKRLIGAGYSYISILPQVLRETNQTKYESLLLSAQDFLDVPTLMGGGRPALLPKIISAIESENHGARLSTVPDPVKKGSALRLVRAPRKDYEARLLQGLGIDPTQALKIDVRRIGSRVERLYEIFRKKVDKYSGNVLILRGSKKLLKDGAFENDKNQKAPAPSVSAVTDSVMLHISKEVVAHFGEKSREHQSLRAQWSELRFALSESVKNAAMWAEPDDPNAIIVLRWRLITNTDNSVDLVIDVVDEGLEPISGKEQVSPPLWVGKGLQGAKGFGDLIEPYISNRSIIEIDGVAKYGAPVRLDGKILGKSIMLQFEIRKAAARLAKDGRGTAGMERGAAMSSSTNSKIRSAIDRLVSEGQLVITQNDIAAEAELSIQTVSQRANGNDDLASLIKEATLNSDADVKILQAANYIKARRKKIGKVTTAFVAAIVRQLHPTSKMVRSTLTFRRMRNKKVHQALNSLGAEQNIERLLQTKNQIFEILKHFFDLGEFEPTYRAMEAYSKEGGGDGLSAVTISHHMESAEDEVEEMKAKHREENVSKESEREYGKKELAPAAAETLRRAGEFFDIFAIARWYDKQTPMTLPDTWEVDGRKNKKMNIYRAMDLLAANGQILPSSKYLQVYKREMAAFEYSRTRFILEAPSFSTPKEFYEWFKKQGSGRLPVRGASTSDSKGSSSMMLNALAFAVGADKRSKIPAAELQKWQFAVGALEYASSHPAIQAVPVISNPKEFYNWYISIPDAQLSWINDPKKKISSGYALAVLNALNRIDEKQNFKEMQIAVGALTRALDEKTVILEEMGRIWSDFTDKEPAERLRNLYVQFTPALLPGRDGLPLSEDYRRRILKFAFEEYGDEAVINGSPAPAAARLAKGEGEDFWPKLESALEDQRDALRDAGEELEDHIEHFSATSFAGGKVDFLGLVHVVNLDELFKQIVSEEQELRLRTSRIVFSHNRKMRKLFGIYYNPDNGDFEVAVRNPHAAVLNSRFLVMAALVALMRTNTTGNLESDYIEWSAEEVKSMALPAALKNEKTVLTPKTYLPGMLQPASQFNELVNYVLRQSKKNEAAARLVEPFDENQEDVAHAEALRLGIELKNILATVRTVLLEWDQNSFPMPLAPQDPAKLKLVAALKQVNEILKPDTSRTPGKYEIRHALYAGGTAKDVDFLSPTLAMLGQLELTDEPQQLNPQDFQSLKVDFLRMERILNDLIIYSADSQPSQFFPPDGRMKNGRGIVNFKASVKQVMNAQKNKLIERPTPFTTDFGTGARLSEVEDEFFDELKRLHGSALENKMIAVAVGQEIGAYQFKVMTNRQTGHPELMAISLSDPSIYYSVGRARKSEDLNRAEVSLSDVLTFWKQHENLTAEQLRTLIQKDGSTALEWNVNLLSDDQRTREANLKLMVLSALKMKMAAHLDHEVTFHLTGETEKLTQCLEFVAAYKDELKTKMTGAAYQIHLRELEDLFVVGAAEKARTVVFTADRGVLTQDGFADKIVLPVQPLKKGEITSFGSYFNFGVGVSRSGFADGTPEDLIVGVWRTLSGNRGLNAAILHDLAMQRGNIGEKEWAAATLRLIQPFNVDALLSATRLAQAATLASA